MMSEMDPTRRSFLKTGALLAAPLAAAAPVAVLAESRPAGIEDEAAIRSLHQAWLRQINTGGCKAAMFDDGIRAVTVDHGGEPDAIEIAADGKSAAGRFHCIVEIETAIAPDCTLAQMAHAQGGGAVRRTERGVLDINYAREGAGWAIARLKFAQA